MLGSYAHSFPAYYIQFSKIGDVNLSSNVKRCQVLSKISFVFSFIRIDFFTKM
nr:MAG TPA: hypothetical protein [Caudoviricetes sp.]